MIIKKYSFILCIIAFNTGCSKQAFFSLSRPSQLRPAPSVINSRNLSLLAQREYWNTSLPLTTSSQLFYYTAHSANVQTQSVPISFQSLSITSNMQSNTNLDLPQAFNSPNFNNPDTSRFADIKPEISTLASLSQPIDFQNRPILNIQTNTNLNLPEYDSHLDSDHSTLQIIDRQTPSIKPSLQQPLNLQNQKAPKLSNTFPPLYSENTDISLSNEQSEVKPPPIPLPPLASPPPQSPPSPSPPPSPQTTQEHAFHTFFPYTWSKASFSQPIHDRNKTTLLFQAYDDRGFPIRDLREEDLIIKENQSEILNYTLSLSLPPQREDDYIELVFVIDTGANMTDRRHIISGSVESLRNELEKYQMHLKFCLVTFKDNLGEKCDNGFIDNNYFSFFQNHISNLKLTGGGGTNTQNPLLGLLAAANIPRSDNQRIVILITDALPWLEGQTLPRRPVPLHSTVLDRLSSQIPNQPGIPVFALTRSHDLFSEITEDTSGQWFDIHDIINRKTGLDDVSHQIREHLNILRAEYIVEDQQGLNPFLSLEERSIEISSQFEDVHIEIQDIQSNMPEGRAEPQSRFLLSRDAVINKDHISVVRTSHGFDERLTNFFIEDGEIVFIEILPEGSQISVQYESGDLIDNIQRHPLVLEGHTQAESSTDQISSISLTLNGKSVLREDFEIELASDNHFYLNLNENVFDNTDPYGIRASGGLNISATYEITN